jgi:hypothetical protein
VPCCRAIRSTSATNCADGSPPQIFISFRPIPLVDQVECIAVVPRLGWARHFRLRPFPLSVVAPFLSQHPPPHLEYHGAMEIQQRSDESVVGPHGETKGSPGMLPTDSAIRSLLHRFRAINLSASTICLRRSDQVDAPHHVAASLP